MLWSPGLTRRNALIAFAVFTAICLLYAVSQHDQVRISSKTGFGYRDEGAKSSALEASKAGSPTVDGPEGQIQEFCKKHDFRPYVNKDTGHYHRKIYDAFLFSNELDWLEIRLNTLAPHVDYFIIIESSTTFTGHHKPLHLQQNWSNFSQFHGKIIHKIVHDPGPSIGLSTWTHEDYFRNSLFDLTFPNLLYTPQEAHEGDVIIISDVDEIPKPETMKILRHCDIPDRLTLRSNFYYYSFQWLHIGTQWPHPQATTFHGLSSTLSPNELRNGIGGPKSWIPFKTMLTRWRQSKDLWNAAWHCSSCFGTLQEMREKMESFSHTPLNTAENKDERVMMERVRGGRDLFGRVGETYKRVEDNMDVPQFVLENRDKYEYMLNRDGENAGFRDWHVPDSSVTK